MHWSNNTTLIYIQLDTDKSKHFTYITDFIFNNPVLEQNSNVSHVLEITVYAKNTLEKAMAPHSSTLAWRIPWMDEPGGLQSTWLQRVRHD